MNSQQLEIQLKQAKYQEFKQDHVKIKSLLEMAQNITHEPNKTFIYDTLVESLGDIVCYMSHNMTQQEEINEVNTLVQNVIQIMEKRQGEWHRNWQNLWARLTNLDLKLN